MRQGIKAFRSRVYQVFRRYMFSILLIILTSTYAILRELIIPFPPWAHAVAQFALPIQLYSYTMGIFLYWLSQTNIALGSIRNTPWIVFFTGGCGIILTHGNVPTVCSLFILAMIAKKAPP